MLFMMEPLNFTLKVSTINHIDGFNLLNFPPGGSEVISWALVRVACT